MIVVIEILNLGGSYCLIQKGRRPLVAMCNYALSVALSYRSGN